MSKRRDLAPGRRADAGPARWLAVGAVVACAAAAGVATSGPAVLQDPPATAAQTPVTSTEDTTRPAPKDDPALPPGDARTQVVTKGNGHVVPITVTGADSWRPGRAVRWSVEAEQGLGLDLDEFAEHVRDTLQDRRGWERVDRVHFERVPAWQVEAGAPVDIRVTLASPATTDRLCAPLQTGGQTSCWRDGRAVINSRRWVKGSGGYRGRLTAYRTYVVNHEVGHGLGHGHEGCRRRGWRAPIMQQQTLGLEGCRAWPYPVDDGSGRRAR